MTEPWIMYGVERSLFSAKLRPALRYKQLHWSEQLPDVPVLFEKTGVAFVPVLMSPDGRWLQDTTDIIDQLEIDVPKPQLIPTTALQRIVCRLIELYADEFAVILAMHTRWSPPASKADMTQYLRSVSPDGGDMFAERMAGMLQLLGVSEQTIPALDAHLNDAVEVLASAFAEQGFFIGPRMSLADCALMGPYYAHVYLDSVSGPRLRAASPSFCHWIEQCNRPNPKAMGEWPADDELTPATHGALRRLGNDAAPILLAQYNALQADDFPNRDPADRLTAPLARFDSTLRNVPFHAAARPYVAYKMQRLIDEFGSLSAAAKDHVRKGIAGTGWEPLLELEPVVRVEKRGGQLYCMGATGRAL